LQEEPKLEGLDRPCSLSEFEATAIVPGRFIPERLVQEPR